MPGSLMLLDSASLYFRAFHGVPESVTAPDGTAVNAVRGFTDMVAQLVSRYRPERLVACWDEDWRPAFRVELLPSYKAHRLAPGSTQAEATPPALAPQVPVIVDLLAAFGIARAGAAGFEADDVIATLCAREVAACGGLTAGVDVVTGDRDLFQLIDDRAGVRVLYTGRGMRNLELVDQALLAHKYGVPDGPAYADMAVLRGDPSDGLPGVPGIGEKTAAGLLQRFGSAEALLQALDDPSLPLPQRARLNGQQDYLRRALGVVRTVADAPVPPVPDALPDTPAHPEQVRELAERWGLESSVVRLLTALTRP